ncbi:Protein sak1 [Schizosaccharomyces pombe]|uniref:Protein sak1 n=1 Tax=Schizosaccharomyces pombe (strain 972 / ATCC 24843) TaxID=284812 RepID=SAK1_SCHPO|nr:transcriptional repressor Sak1 [Schizosaccharomyces pombe]P48383.2 RecName: Full=Protein sak1 [Schizosaccharomyces pombe 972h-]CAA15923.1 transcriptional repressor Sak1 [Schizosaccharomyces pombe]|eukprot:NP_594086.1 transcriptional repressor Sak1 [Schizosaccharomyces pombe]
MNPSDLPGQIPLSRSDMNVQDQLDPVQRFDTHFMLPQEENFLNRPSITSESAHPRGSDLEQETELKRLALEHEHYSLESLAEKLRMDHVSANSEKFRQVFGICWLKRACEEQQDAAVQRNQIYAHYVEICNSLHIKPLNSASFGKLVRLLFPSIKTRRLGMRGHSKYHYCGIKLRGQDSFRRLRTFSDSSLSPVSCSSFPKPIPNHFENDVSSIQNTNQRVESSPASVNAAAIVRKSAVTPSSDPYNSPPPSIPLLGSQTNLQLAPSFAAPQAHPLPSHLSQSNVPPQLSHSSVPSPAPPRSVSQPTYFSQPMPQFSSSFVPGTSSIVPTLHPASAQEDFNLQHSLFFKLKLKFLPPHKLPWIPSLDVSSFSLPPIDYYLNGPYDNVEAKSALMNIYSSHCITLIESVRYMHLKQFLSEISNFPNSLSPSLLALLSSPYFTKWIERSDTVMYREILKLLFPMTLQVVPPPVLVLLRHLAENLVNHISSIYASHSSCLLQVKSETAAIFSNLLSRLLRVNDTAHAAARFLANPADRHLICNDWERFVSTRFIVHRELMCNDKEAVAALDEWYSILSTCSNPSELLDPLKDKHEASDTSMNRVELRQIDGVLDRMADFFLELPSRFPSCSPRMFLLCLGALQTSVLREITVSGGEAFGALWVIRCWVDEYMTWVAEIGGYLDDSYDELEQHHANFHNKAGISQSNIPPHLQEHRQSQQHFQQDIEALQSQQQQQATKNSLMEAAYQNAQKQKEDDYISIVFDTNGACS